LLFATVGVRNQRERTTPELSLLQITAATSHHSYTTALVNLHAIEETQL